MSVVVDVNIDQDENIYERLKKAAQDGDIEKLYALIAQDPDILEHFDKVSFCETPLHVAAENGKTHFAMEVMNLKPSLAMKLNVSGYSPLHLALQGKHVRMVRGFVAMDSSLVSIKGRGRITPLHHVARVGDSELLSEFLLACPSSIQDLTIKCETAVHVAVKNHQFEAFKILLGWIQRVKREDILDWKDEDGNTVYHNAASMNQTEVMKLLGKTVKVNAKNLDGKTAAEILQTYKSPFFPKASRFLRRAKERLFCGPTMTLGSYLSKKPSLIEKRNSLLGLSKIGHGSQSSDSRSMILVVAILVVTATYQAGLSPPGGFWQESSPNVGDWDSHVAGQMVMPFYIALYFYVLNGIAFFSSLYVIMILIVGLPMWKVLYGSIAALAIANIATLSSTFPIGDDLADDLVENVIGSILNFVYLVTVGSIVSAPFVEFLVTSSDSSGSYILPEHFEISSNPFSRVFTVHRFLVFTFGGGFPRWVVTFHIPATTTAELAFSSLFSFLEMDVEMGDSSFMEERNDKVKVSSRKRSRKPKPLEFLGWGSKNLIEFLQSLGRDTTNKISEQDVTSIIMSYIREKNHAYDHIIKVPDLVEKHYVENQDDDAEFGFLFDSDDDKGQQRLSLSDKIDKQITQVVKKPKGTLAAIVMDNVKLLYLRKSLVQELAKTPETFGSKVLGTFVKIKNPSQLVQITGVKEGNPIDGHFLQVANYSYHLEDVPSSVLSDDDFSPEECAELRQRIKNGCVKRLTVVDMEEKVRSLHEDVTKHWIARELALLRRRINQASEKGWRREYPFCYLEERELLENPEEQSMLLREVPEVVAEEVLEPQCVYDGVKIEHEFMEPIPVVYIEAPQSEEEQQQLSDSPVDSVKIEDEFMEPSPVAFNEAPQSEEEKQQLSDSPVDSVHDGVKIENDFMEPNPGACIKEEQQQLSDSPVDSVQKNQENSKLGDGEDQPSLAASADDKKDKEPPENAENKEPITENVPQAQSNPVEIIELSDDDDDDDEEDNDNGVYEKCDPKKVMWCYEQPKGRTNGPFSLAQLKEWNDEEYFVHVPDFKVWMTGKGMRSAVLLTKLLHHIKA
ncbi:unnamed protein product [Microthlaspi erraticum]|uniref:GYF domain-containing protein n=1 Tax=Microthlaspi erraticum TaxID=1685480 RepID=A0A6D2IDP2_9BRAS|nr:unnamed protein product [Microthlaspi erraticum]